MKRENAAELEKASLEDALESLSGDSAGRYWPVCKSEIAEATILQLESRHYG